MEIPIMRTVKETVSECKSSDPNTGITEWFIRSLIRSGKLPVIKAGKKYLINMEDFCRIMKSKELTNFDKVKVKIRELK